MIEQGPKFESGEEFELIEPKPESLEWKGIYPEIQITEMGKDSFSVNVKPEQSSLNTFELEFNHLLDLGSFDYKMLPGSTDTSFRINQVTRDQVEVLIDQAQDLAIQDWQMDQHGTVEIPPAAAETA